MPYGTRMRSFARRPVVDETQLEGSYDVVVEWDLEAGSRALHVALGDAGFELAPASRRHLVYVVEAAE